MPEPSKEIGLEAASTRLEPVDDSRPKIEQPPPVRLMSVEDCVLSAPAGLERELDEFYVGLLRFEREEAEHEIVYRAENFRLRITVLEIPLPREDFRPLPVAVDSFNDFIGKLNEAEIEFVRQRGLTPGQDNLLLTDPAGNRVEVSEFRIVI